MSTPQEKLGLAELSDARRESRTLFWFVGIFSFFVNLLMLTGPIYMLQVYDRVLGSRSEATLVALTLLVAFLYGMMGLLDFARGRIIGRVGAKFQARLDRRVFEAVWRISAFVDESTRATYYRAEIILNDGQIDRLPANVTLIPGMPVEAFIRTSDRSPLSYLVKPLTDYFAKAFREG